MLSRMSWRETTEQVAFTIVAIIVLLAIALVFIYWITKV